MSASVFPAYVGMSPLVRISRLSLTRVPRIRGDEPYEVFSREVRKMCSPHTWG